MGAFFTEATKQETLGSAWRHVRSRGISSNLKQTRDAVELFERDASRQIRRIQNRIRSGVFEFDPQQGVLKKKESGSFRGIVMASVHNRIVERAILETLQKKSAFVREVLSNPFSVGGVPERSVPHGLFEIRSAFEAGKQYFARSDISGFFDNIPREVVLEKLAEKIDDKRFIDLLRRATTVCLANEKELGDNRRAFPVDDLGVAQGSPLSPLMGNILLHKFDKEFNSRGLRCIRFVDDFVLLGKTKTAVFKGFDSASKYLSALGLTCHDPFASNANKLKSEQGQIGEGFVFLGHDIRPGQIMPSEAARKSILAKVDDRLGEGRLAIKDVHNRQSSFVARNRYVQTLDQIDRILRGWGDAFAYGNASNVINDLDEKIEMRLKNFRDWYRAYSASMNWRERRRTGGVCLLTDIEAKSLDELPFRISVKRRFSETAQMQTVSTDGSVITSGRRRSRDKGPGGWAYINHETGKSRGGFVTETTNNRMELLAVIEAVKSLDPKKPICILSQETQPITGSARRILSSKRGWFKTVLRDEAQWSDGSTVSSANARCRVTTNIGSSVPSYRQTSHRLSLSSLGE